MIWRGNVVTKAPQKETYSGSCNIWASDIGCGKEELEGKISPISTRMMIAVFNRSWNRTRIGHGTGMCRRCDR